MSKHTPGPWLIALNNPHAGDVASIYDGSEGVLNIWSEHWGEVPAQNGDANARLIAAAPDLLEALLACEAELMQTFHRLPERDQIEMGPVHAMVISQAQNAIAKAEG